MVRVPTMRPDQYSYVALHVNIVMDKEIHFERLGLLFLVNPLSDCAAGCVLFVRNFFLLLSASVSNYSVSPHYPVSVSP